jgi:hypothetical protein
MLGPPKAAAQGASRYGGWGHISDGALCAMSGHLVDALGDVVGGLESSTDGMTACAVLDLRD